MMRVSNVPNVSPNIMENARGPQSADALAKGIMPMTVVMVVKTMGRRRLADASTTMSASVMPLAEFARAMNESTRMMPLLMMTPDKAMTPRREGKDTGWPVNKSPVRTPLKESGTRERR